jgi:undecaprenyl-diphosphatase
MFADRMELVAAVAATVWFALAAGTVVAHRRAVPRHLVRADVLIAGGVAALLFGAGAALADHVDDEGQGPTAYDSSVWTFAVEHRDTVGTVVASALRVGGGIIALGVLAGGVGLLLALRGRRLDAPLVVSTPLVSTLLGDTLKLGYGRPRPPAAEQLIPEAGFSLPSGHTVDATVVFGVLALVLVARTASRWGRAAIVAVAVVTITAAGAGRVYLGVHWATDVVTGWLLGAAWVALCAVVLLLAERGHRLTSAVGTAPARGSAESRRPARCRPALSDHYDRAGGELHQPAARRSEHALGVRPAPAADHDGAGRGRLIHQRPQGGVVLDPRLDHQSGTALTAPRHPRLERHRRVGDLLDAVFRGPAHAVAARGGDDVAPGVHGEHVGAVRGGDLRRPLQNGVGVRPVVHAGHDRPGTGWRQSGRGSPDHRHGTVGAGEQGQREGAGEHPGADALAIAPDDENPVGFGPLEQRIGDAALDDLRLHGVRALALGRVDQLAQPRREHAVARRPGNVHQEQRSARLRRELGRPADRLPRRVGGVHPDDHCPPARGAHQPSRPHTAGCPPRPAPRSCRDGDVRPKG